MDTNRISCNFHHLLLKNNTIWAAVKFYNNLRVVLQSKRMVLLAVGLKDLCRQQSVLP